MNLPFFHRTLLAIIFIAGLFCSTSVLHADGIYDDVQQLKASLRTDQGFVPVPKSYEPIRIEYKDGYVYSLGAPMGYYLQIRNIDSDPTVSAVNFLKDYPSAFGLLSNQVGFVSKKSRLIGKTRFERLQQTYAGVPVYGGEAIVQLTLSGGVQYVLCDVMRDTTALDSRQVSLTPAIASADAAFLARDLLASEHPQFQMSSTTPQLMIYKPSVVGNTGATHLVWKTEVTADVPGIADELVLIDAQTGEVAWRFSQLTYDRFREIYDSNNSAEDPGTLERSEGDDPTGIADVDMAYDALGDVYDFYFEENGRDSIDNAGMVMSATVRYCQIEDPAYCPFENAFWDPAVDRMYFGEGFVVDDVTAHEMTHGVTSYESNLIYANESGAINESFSDMWGEWIDLTNESGNDSDAVRWELGEDLPASVGVIRDMSDPTRFGDPDSKCSPYWYDGPMDNGGVHWNSGVGNKLCYLLTDGDTFKGVEITGMGISATATLMYEVQTNLLTSASDYADFQTALLQATVNLGFTDVDRENVRRACLVTELAKCFDVADLEQVDQVAPTPNPAQWDIQPTATGMHHIVMQAKKASDPSGVEYAFDCLEDESLSSGWQTSRLYQLGLTPDKMPDAGATYTFQVRYRDLSENQNESQPSSAVSTTTDLDEDLLPPAPNPARWESLPRNAEIYRKKYIAMAAAQSYDESGVEYYFDCISAVNNADPNEVIDFDLYDSGWQIDNNYQVEVIQGNGYEYTFQVYTRQTGQTDPMYQSEPSVSAGAYVGAGPRVLGVPYPYANIQAAVDTLLNYQNNGNDVTGSAIVVQPGTYFLSGNYNIDPKGLPITIRSVDPHDPEIVAATIIDPPDDLLSAGSAARAFIFQSGETRNTAIDGFTIQGAYAVSDPGTPPSSPGTNGALAQGGAIYCTNNSSPTISNCVIRNCYAWGQNGSDGRDASPSPAGSGAPGEDGDPGDDGGPGLPASETVYYVKPIDDVTAIRLAGESLTVQGREVFNGADDLIAEVTDPNDAGGIQLFDPDNNALGNEATFEAGDIDGSITITLKDGPDGDPLDTIILADWTDSLSVGSVESNDGLVYIQEFFPPFGWDPNHINLTAIYYDPATPDPNLYERTVTVGRNINVLEAAPDNDPTNPIQYFIVGNGTPTLSVFFSHNGVVVNETVNAVTIAAGGNGGDGDNGGTSGIDGTDGSDGGPGQPGGHGGDGQGGAIFADDFCSPLIVACRILSCQAVGGNGGAGGNGAHGGAGGDGANGGDGGNGGDGADGVEVLLGGVPFIFGGDGGNGGDGGRGGNGGNGGRGGDGGRGGNGGNGLGGAISFGLQSSPEIIDTEISGCSTRIGMGNYGGEAGNGGNGGNGGEGGGGGDGGAGGADGGLDGEDGQDGPSGFGGSGGDGGIGGDSGWDGGSVAMTWGGTSWSTWAGAANGGAIYAFSECNLTMSNSTLDGNISSLVRNDRTVDRYHGGNGGNGGNGGDAPIDPAAGPGGDGGDGGWAGGIDDDAYVVSFGGNGGNGGNGGDGGNGGAGGGGNGGNGGPGHITANQGGGGGGGNRGGGNGSAGGFITFAQSALGGGVFMEGGTSESNMTVIDANNCTFSDNMAQTDDGGGFYIDTYSTNTFVDCQFITNTTADDGGGVCFYQPLRSTFTDCLFSGNLAGTAPDEGTDEFEGGGAIAYDMIGTVSGTLIPGHKGFLGITNCTFEDNILDPIAAQTTDYSTAGGAIWAYGDSQAPMDMSVVIQDSTFMENQAEYGGAVNGYYDFLTIQNCDFTGNRGEIAGAVYSAESDVLFEGCDFSQNAAIPFDFSEMNAASGGALYCETESVQAYDCRFTENTAQASGGAVFIAGPFDYIPGGTQDFVNCLMVQNTAGGDGGAMAVMNGAEPYLINSTIADNTLTEPLSYGGGISVGYDIISNEPAYLFESFVFLENSIVWNNLAELGPQIGLGNPLNPGSFYCTAGLSHTVLEGGLEDVFYGEPTDRMLAFDLYEDLNDYEGSVFDVDPDFIAAKPTAEDAYYLSHEDAGQFADSNSIDLGTDAGYVTDLATFLMHDITTRTDHEVDEGAIDLGYHYDAADPVDSFTLTTSVALVDGISNGFIQVGDEGPKHVEPMSATYLQGTELKLYAYPDPNDVYRVAYWSGTDDDTSFSKENKVTMTGNRSVQVEFELGVPKNLYVPTSYATVEDAITAAKDGDSIILAPRPSQPYTIADPEGINFGGKQVVLTSLDPEDPNIVANTIIDCQGSANVIKRAFHFNSGEDENTRIEGITIRNAYMAVRGADAAVTTGRWPWWNGPVPDAWTEEPPNPNPLPPYRALSGEDAIGDSYGGALLIENGSSPTIYNCVFENCTVSGGIGGDGADGYWQPPFEGAVLPEGNWDGVSGGHGGDGSGNGYGGAIAIRNGSSPSIVGCIFRNNHAAGGLGGNAGDGGTAGGDGRFSWGGNGGNSIGDGRGGAIFVDAGCRPTLRNNFFENNTVASRIRGGLGGIAGDGEEYPAPFELDNLGAFRDGSDGGVITLGANGGGAVFFMDGANSTLDNCVFRNNIAPSGGAIYADPNVTLTILSCEFTKQGGGAIYMDDWPALQITDSQFMNNTAGFSAGAITVGSQGLGLQISDSNFIGNTTAWYGGAIESYSDLTVEKSEFMDNSAGFDGGAVYAIAPNPDVHALRLEYRDCLFGRNKTPEYGGALFADNALVTIDDCKLFMNEAISGGALHMALSDVDMRNCIVFGNEATDVPSGLEGFGGGIYVIDSPFLIENTRFENNQASGLMSAGGAICVTGSQTYYQQDLINCLFANNYAVNDGGGIACLQFVELALDNCTVADNLANSKGGGLFVDYNSNVSLYSSIISGNEGYGIYERRPSCDTFVDYSLFYANAPADIYDAQTDADVSGAADLTATAGYADILDTDPQHVIGPWGEYYLSQGGPAVDPFAADAEYPTAAEVMLDTLTTDAAGTLDQATVDLGYHYDVPTPDDYVQYTLAASVLNPQMLRGTVSPTGGTYLPFAVVNVVAVPNTVDPDTKDFRVYRWIDSVFERNNQFVNPVLMYMDRSVQVEFEPAVPKNLYVPETYDTIEEAIVAAHDDDRIILAPRPDSPYLITNPDGINFGGKRLLITSTNPDDPEIVASTIIDCQGSRYLSKRAFHFENGEGADSRIEGITIRNAFTAEIGLSAAISTGMWPWWTGSASWYFGIDPPEPWDTDPPDPLPPSRALSGADATGDSYGGAILCENGSSPTIYKCVFENCTVAGGVGGDGADGNWPDDYDAGGEDLDSQSGGHSGMGSGDGFGGAIAIRSGSSPTIQQCVFRNNRATGGWGGIPGDAGRSYNNGRYGWGGNDPAGLEYAAEYGINPMAGYGEGDGHGGAIYVEAGCDPTIYNCDFTGNYARPGYVSPGGAQAAGDEYPEPFDYDTVGARGLRWEEQDARTGYDGFLITHDTIAGGAIYFESDADITLEGCTFEQNQAYVVSGPDDSPVPTRGGALHCDPNAILRIQPLYDSNDPTRIVKKSSFTGNIGSALYVSTGADVDVFAADFINNTSTYPVEDDTIALVTPAFDLAGAVTVEVNAGDDPNFVGCQFLGNASDIGGGAIRTQSNMELTDCILNGNSSQSNGGAIYMYDPVDGPDVHTLYLTLNGCELSGNDAKGLGGAGFVKNCNLFVDDSFLVSNTAFSGGAFRVSAGYLNLTNSLVYGNAATGVIAGSHRTVTQEGFGGGFHVTDSPFIIERTRFENNRADGVIAAGGALCVTGSQTYYDQAVNNCLFANNRSDNIGGAAACQLYVDILFTNCTFADNTSDAKLGGGLYVNHLSTAMLQRCIISGNDGYGIYEKEDGQSIVSDSLFYNNSDGDLRDSSGLIYAGTDTPTGYSDIMVADPQFAQGKLGGYYLVQSGPAVDAGNISAVQAGLDDLTTSIEDYSRDTGDVDLGYHYMDSADLPQFTLTGQIVDEINMNQTVEEGGTITLEYGDRKTGSSVSDLLPRGAIVPLSANIVKQYYLTGWSGGTFNDNTRGPTNTVLMTRDKMVKVGVRLRRTLNMGASMDYDTLGDAIDDARDGDIILVAPGEYTAASEHPSPLNQITLDGKNITISGTNPDDESIVRGTVFRDYDFIISNVQNETVIEGINLDQSQMDLLRADIILRNCVFSNCRFFRPDRRHTPPVPAGTDGYHQYPIVGGALGMAESSPVISNCVFENNAVTGADGENGFGGAQSHLNGGDGGWPSPTYGGAVYCGLSSQPQFIGCRFVGNEAIGANGGNGANFAVINNTPYYGGRGGGWVYDDVTEQYLRDLTLGGGWDGWTFNSYGDKYGAWSYYEEFFGEYDIDLWAKWFNWGDRFATWDAFDAAYSNDSYDPSGDPYDQMMDVWRYSGFGGAVYCEMKTKATFIDCDFEDNQSHGGLTGVGGAQSGDTIANGVPWPDRQLNMPTAGGAVFAAFDSDLTFESCRFSNNVADTDTVALPHTYQVSFGGAVAYEYDCQVTFTNCDISENTATVGGGIYGFDSVAKEIADCNVFGNEAFMGAGIYLEDNAATITGTRLRSNRAGIPATIGQADTLDQAGQGGGIYAHVQDLNIRDSVFVENRAGISGGGLMLSGTVIHPSEMFNCLFAGNRAPRDGGGASVNWIGGDPNDTNRSENAMFTNCTFADNYSLGDQELGYLGSGAGLFCGYDSVVTVLDSIFYRNLAYQGEQITVAGSEFSGNTSQRPSDLKIEYSNVQGFPSANAIYVAPGCDLQLDPANILNWIPTNPLNAFDTLPTADADDVSEKYYLKQTDSPWVDAGSQTSVQAALNGYTTSIYGALDRGLVDLGYHYKLSPRSDCGRIDETLILSGRIDLADLAILFSEWQNNCSSGIDDWCGGADLNYDGVVDILDLSSGLFCWLEEDTEAPKPNPSEWAIAPRAIPGSLNQIEMAAVVHHDNWWPDEDIRYRFYVADEAGDPQPVVVEQDKVANGGNADGFVDYTELGPESKDETGNTVLQIYTKLTGLIPKSAYSVYVQAWDASDNATALSQKVDVTPGEQVQPPVADWATEPYNAVVNDQSVVRMVAVEYADLPNVPDVSGYDIRYVFEKDGTQLPEDVGQASPVYVDNAVTNGQSITYHVRILVFVNYQAGISVLDDAILVSDWSDPVTLVVEEADLTPPTPLKAQHAAAPASIPISGTYYQIVEAVEAEDPSGVEYRFVCSDSTYSSGGSNGPLWRNDDNVGVGTAYQFYPDGSTQVPYRYVVGTGIINKPNLVWYITYRDRSPYHNQGQTSDGWSAAGPNPVD